MNAFAIEVIQPQINLIKVVRDLGYGTGKEAIRMLKSAPKWKPGIQNRSAERNRCETVTRCYAL